MRKGSEQPRRRVALRTATRRSKSNAIEDGLSVTEQGTLPDHAARGRSPQPVGQTARFEKGWSSCQHNEERNHRSAPSTAVLTLSSTPSHDHQRVSPDDQRTGGQRNTPANTQSRVLD